MLGAHHTAVKARLQANPALSEMISDVVRRKENGEYVQENYVVLAVNIPGYEPRLANVQDALGDADLEVYTRVVAGDVDGLNDLTDAVSTQLQGHALIVAGRAVTQLNRTELELPAYDKATDLFHRDAWFEATTSPL